MLRIMASQAFLGHAVQFVDVGKAQIAYRKVGSGPPLLVVHGWPLWGFTWRNLLPRLATHTCYVIDLPGGGYTKWSEDNDFNFRGQAENLVRFVDGVGLEKFDVLAQDTGATIARELAIIVGERVRRMAMVNTEIPGHRPPWVRTFQWSSALPGAEGIFRRLLASRGFCRSSMGFGNCFADKGLIDGDFREQIIQPLIDDPYRLRGQLRYLRGIDWRLVDSLRERHKQIRARVLFVWGADDPTFPEALAREMLPQLGSAELRSIPGAKLLVHEEKPDEVAAQVLPFLQSS
jgi:pimeloyl-ACP methyl ester carboxylesterase